MESTIGLREIELNDADAVAVLTEQLGYRRSVEEIRAWIAEHKPDQEAFVAVLDGKVVGWVEVSIERRLQSAPFALIGGLVVSDDLRNKGIGRLLCECAEAWALEQGVDKVRVTSRSTRADAHRFYLRDGYTPVKTSMVFEKKIRPKENRP